MRSKDSYRSGKRNKMKGSFVPSVEARPGQTNAGEPRGKSFYAIGGVSNFFFPNQRAPRKALPRISIAEPDKPDKK